MYNLLLTVMFLPAKNTAAVGTRAKIMVRSGQNELLALLYVNEKFLIKNTNVQYPKHFERLIGLTTFARVFARVVFLTEQTAIKPYSRP